MQAISTDYTSPTEKYFFENYRVLEVLPGATSGMLSVFPQEDITFSKQSSDTQVEEYLSLIFMIEGEIELTCFTKDEPVSSNFTPNTFTLFQTPSEHISCSLMKRTQTNMLGIDLSIEHLKQLLEVNDKISLDNMMRIHEPVALNVTQKRILHQMFNCTKHGMAYSLYLKGKAVELLSEFIESVLTQAHGCCKKYGHCLGLEEINSVKSAKQILENNMINPPCLTKLSKLVGLNVNKLQYGFHCIYNTTPYAFLREARMIKSGNLLANSEMSVSQVAWEVGYSSFGHFSEAFQVHYGVNPKAFQMSKASNNASKRRINKI